MEDKLISESKALYDSLYELSSNAKLSKKESKVINSLIEAVVQLGNELDEVTTEALTYKDLCSKSLFFTQLQKVLNFGNKIVHLKDLERKRALKECARPQKVKGVDDLASEISKLSRDEQASLIAKLRAEQEEE